MVKPRAIVRLRSARGRKPSLRIDSKFRHERPEKSHTGPKQKGRTGAVVDDAPIVNVTSIRTHNNHNFKGVNDSFETPSPLKGDDLVQSLRVIPNISPRTSAVLNIPYGSYIFRRKPSNKQKFAITPSFS